MTTSIRLLIQKDNFTTSWKLRGLPAVNNLPAVVSGRPKLDYFRDPGSPAFPLSRASAWAKPL